MMTYHSKKRIKERMGYKGKTAEKIIQKAYAEGKDFTQVANTQVRDYLIRKENKASRKAKIYQGHCFIFADTICITVLDLPKAIIKMPLCAGKERIKDLAKYQRLYGPLGEREEDRFREEEGYMAS